MKNRSLSNHRPRLLDSVVHGRIRSMFLRGDNGLTYPLDAACSSSFADTRFPRMREPPSETHLPQRHARQPRWREFRGRRLGRWFMHILVGASRRRARVDNLVEIKRSGWGFIYSK